MFVIKKIIIADDHPLFRDALQQALRQTFEGIEIIDADSFATLQRVVCDFLIFAPNQQFVTSCVLVKVTITAC